MVTLKLLLVLLCSSYTFVVSTNSTDKLYSAVDTFHCEDPENYITKKEQYLKGIEKSLHQTARFTWSRLRGAEDAAGYWSTEMCMLVWNAEEKPKYVKNCIPTKYLMGQNRDYGVKFIRLDSEMSLKKTGDFLKCSCQYMPINNDDCVINEHDFFVVRLIGMTYVKLIPYYQHHGLNVNNQHELIITDYFTPNKIQMQSN